MDDKSRQPLLPDLPSRPKRRRSWLTISLAFLLILKGYLFHSFIRSHRVPPISPEFRRHCTDRLQAPPGTYTGRLDRLQALARDEPTLWISEPSASAAYFIGAFSQADWWASERPFLIGLLTANSSIRVILLTPEFERLRAQGVRLPDEVKVEWVGWREDESPYRVLKDAVGLTRVILDGGVRAFVADGIRNAFGAHNLHFKGSRELEAEVLSLRERKDEWEIDLLRCANQYTLHAIRKTRSRMHVGITESATHRVLEQELAAVGLTEGDGLVLFGENAALPHGSGTDRRLGENDLILIDAGGKWGGYVADITRTFALASSKIPPEHIHIWNTVRRAQLAAHDLLHHFNTTNPPEFASLDIAARSVIANAFPSNSVNPDYSVFTHRLGHGIGLEGHESPYAVQGPLGDRPVLPGHVFSIEPGIYVPAEGAGVGVRLEDCFVVGQDENGKLGGEWLSGPVMEWGDV